MCDDALQAHVECWAVNTLDEFEGKIASRGVLYVHSLSAFLTIFFNTRLIQPIRFRLIIFLYSIQCCASRLKRLDNRREASEYLYRSSV